MYRLLGLDGLNELYDVGMLRFTEYIDLTLNIGPFFRVSELLLAVGLYGDVVAQLVLGYSDSCVATLS